jgi:hypothetical protein
MKRMSPGIAIIALWFTFAPLLAPASALSYLFTNGISWSIPSGEELVAGATGDTSTAYAMAAERASARAQASWQPLSISVYYFEPSLRGLAFFFSDGGGQTAVAYAYGGALSFVLSVVCGIGLWLRRAWSRYLAILLSAANLPLAFAKGLSELPLTPPSPWPLIVLSGILYILMMRYLFHRDRVASHGVAM